jgi:protein-tyrosine phosphatase
MIDIHCHILPGIDDGAKDLSASLEMARLAAQDGINIIVASPHVSDNPASPEVIRDITEFLNEQIQVSGLDVQIIRGADVSMNIDPSLIDRYTIGDTRYFLLEFPHSHMPGNARDVIFRYVSGGFIPIVTHPERNGSVVEDPSIVEGLLESGALVQVTSLSLSGEFGLAAQSCAKFLLKKGWVHFLASDGHSPTWRPPILSDGVRVAAKILGDVRARSLVEKNPLCLLEGKTVYV